MKMHKIRNIDKSVCTAEQKIAYNYAFMWRKTLKKIHDSDAMQVVKHQAYQDVINSVIRGIKEQSIDKRYNIDAIVHCFRNGIENYINGYSILTSYEEIGKTFSCLYDIE